MFRCCIAECGEDISEVFQFNPTSPELCLLNQDSAVAVIVRAKDQEIKELKKRVAELEAAANKDLCVLAPAKADAAATKEQRDRGAACEEQGDNDGEEKERKNEEEEDEEDEEMDEERKDDEDENEEEEEEEEAEQDEQKEEKTKKGQDNKKGEKEDGENEEGKEKEGEKEDERKDGNDDEERDHDADNEHNDMNEENQTKHQSDQVSCHHEVEMNKKLEAISRKFDFGQDVDFGERDYEAVRTLSSIVDGVQNRDEFIEKRKLKDFDSPLSSVPAKRAKQRNEEIDHGEETKTIPEQEKVGPPKKKWSDLKLNVNAFEKYN
ncbi:Ubiquitinyl hydrolase 1 [Handroanthus impetiginosus]|uniref:Ubiquitinyl hydrolase 1 n=1 Tax=Handroanthus impetiginosus TaxID=429701 RepID=A0A2G9HTV7_9LAMI|nr:Ubiquitinyl hydrolase 1 [Handroanthus impetiginosus]